MNLKDPNVQVALIGLAGSIIITLIAAPYVTELLENQPPILDDLTPSRDSPQDAYSVITWSANSSDREDDIAYYNFWLKGPSTKFKKTEMSGWTKSNKWNWTASDLDVGVSIVTVQVKDLQHPNESHQLEKEYYIKYPNGLDEVHTQCQMLSKFRRYDEAINCCEKCIDINQNDTYAWLLKGYVLKQKGKYAEALRAYDQALSIDPLYKDAWNYEVYLLYEKGDHADAVKACDQSINIDPSQINIWNYKGAALYILRNYNDSIKAYNEALRIDPCYTNSVEGKCMSLKALGKSDEVNATLAKAEAQGCNV